MFTADVLSYIKESTSEHLKTFLTTYKNVRTQTEYKNAIYAICNFLKKDFTEIGIDDARKYFDFLEQRYFAKKISRATIGARISYCNSFAKYLAQRLTNYENPYGSIKRPELHTEVDPCKVPMLEELDVIISKAKETSDMLYLIIALSMRTALTTSEIVKLKTSSFVIENETMYIILDARAQDGKTTYVKVPDDVRVLVENYMKKQIYFDEAGHIFYNEWKNPLTLRNVDKLIATAVKKSGVETNYTLKDFRSRGILDMINSGADEKDIASYSRISDARIRQFIASPGTISGKSPAELVNYRLVTD